jgi:hypothetical protein
MAVTIIEGVRDDARPAHRDQARFAALVSAVRDHEERSRNGEKPSRPRDERLYRRVREICADPGSRRWIS